MSDVKTPPRRLVELNPEWVMTTSGEVYGIGYDCPCDLPRWVPTLDEHGKWKTGADGKVIGPVPYEQCCPRGGREIVPVKSTWIGKLVCADSVARGWALTGTSFENVTLTPSIHAIGHWHGFLTGGVLRSC